MVLVKIRMDVTSKAINDGLSRTIEAPLRCLVVAVVGLVGLVVADEVVNAVVEAVGGEVWVLAVLLPVVPVPVLVVAAVVDDVLIPEVEVPVVPVPVLVVAAVVDDVLIPEEVEVSVVTVVAVLVLVLAVLAVELPRVGHGVG